MSEDTVTYEIELTAEQVKASFLNEARLSMALLEAEARIAELTTALICVGDKHPDGGLCWCPGDWPWNDQQPHAKACQRARAALAAVRGTADGEAGA